MVIRKHENKKKKKKSCFITCNGIKSYKNINEQMKRMKTNEKKICLSTTQPIGVGVGVGWFGWFG